MFSILVLSKLVIFIEPQFVLCAEKNGHPWETWKERRQW